MSMLDDVARDLRMVTQCALGGGGQWRTVASEWATIYLAIAMDSQRAETGNTDSVAKP